VGKVAEKEAFYKRNVRVNAPFPFLPLDRTIAPTLQFDNWPGPWSDFDKAIHVRKNALKVFGGQGSVEVNVRHLCIQNPPTLTSTRFISLKSAHYLYSPAFHVNSTLSVPPSPCLLPHPRIRRRSISRETLA
jgi:hypothetical protein